MRTPSLASSSAHPGPPPPPLDGWRRFGAHGLRLVDGVLLDFPLPVPAGARCWVATVSPDHRSPSGGGAVAWPLDVTGGRGWRSLPRIAVGDVLEFGVDERIRRRKVVSTRWWGVIADYDGSWLLSVQGPHPTPALAHAAATRLIQARHLQVVDPSPAAPPAPRRCRARSHLA